MLSGVFAARWWSMMLYTCTLSLTLSKMVETHVETTLFDVRLYEPEC